ncbi:MAG: SDR family oxidoreductase [Pseudomonadota bacterium]
MLLNDFRGKAVLVTGGTKGIGLTTGLAFGREGAHVYLTHKWGSADEGEICRKFEEAGAPRPSIVEADAAVDEDTVRLLEVIKEDHAGIEVFISNVSFAQVIKGMDDYKKRSFLTSVKYTTWPFVGYIKQMKKIFDRYPRYALNISSDGPDNYYPGYDFVAASKSLVDLFCRYLTIHLFDEDIRMNSLRTRPVSTESLVATFGTEYEPFLRKYYSDDYFVEPEQVGDAALALCSGLMDSVSGQIIMLDRGVAFCDNLMRLFEDREQYGLTHT